MSTKVSFVTTLFDSQKADPGGDKITVQAYNDYHTVLLTVEDRGGTVSVPLNDIDVSALIDALVLVSNRQRQQRAART